MANNTSTFVLKLETKGMPEAQRSSKDIRENLEGAQKAASTMKMARSAAAQPTGMAGVTAGVTGREVEDYNRASGAAGKAGGTARDFADQARGLGGLVRLYATVAANTFALTAAFGALSRAMDTTNMVKGLDQLGAASGVALGSLSKRLVDATDGAISLREAMEATTKAVSSGMNSDDVLRLGNVAKQASQALGVDMGDAISRLTRGITKLEPELLDELGIFTKLDPAVKAYAKSVNKSVSELSDFERRQAFANAVLAEGEEKFSSIKIDANPYTQLSAAVRDSTQSILEFVNKVVAPVASFFSQSPTALITGITAIAALLVKQALPAIGEFKQGLEQTAKRAQDLAQQKATQAQQARQLINQKIVDEVEARADKELAAVVAAEKKIEQLQQGTLNKRSAAYKLLSKDLQDVQEQDLKRVESAARKAEAGGKSAEAAAYREVVVAIRAQKAAEEDLVATKQRLTAQVEKDAQSWGTYGQTVRAGQKAQEAAIRSGIISNAAYNGSLIGVIGSLKLLREEIAKNNITGFSAAMLTARGAIAAIGGAVSTAMNALNGFFMLIGLITAAVSTFDGIFSKASKEISAFGDSVTRTEGATKNLTNTFDAIYKINPFSVQSLEAQANAIGEFSSSVDDLAKNAQKALRALESSGWDKFKDTIKGILNFDIQSTFTESLSEGIVEAVKGIDNKAISEELKTKLSGILNVKDVTNLEQLEKALKGLKPTSGIVLEVQRALKGAATEAGIAASKAREFVTAFDASKEAFRELSKQFEVNDATTKWANTTIAALVSLSKNLDGPIAGSIANLVKISEEIDKAPIFGNSSLAVAQLNTELKNAQQLMIRSEQEAQNLEKSLEDLQNLAKKDIIAAAGTVDRVTPRDRPGVERDIVSTEISRLEKEIAKARAARKEAESSAEGAALKINSAINTGLTESISLVASGISAALSKGSTQVLQSIYSKIDIVPELAGKQFDLKLKELSIQETSIKTQQDLSNRISLLTAELAVTNAAATLQKAEEQARSSGGGEKAQFAAGQVRSAQEELKNAATRLSLLRQAATDPQAALKDLNALLLSGASGVKGFSKEIVDAANRNAGFIKSLQDINAQQRVIKNVEKPLAEEAAGAKAEIDKIDARLRLNATAREELQLQMSLNKENQIETLEKLRIAQLDQTSLEFDKKKLQDQTAYNSSLILASALMKEGSYEDAKKVTQAAVAIKQQSDAARIAEKRVKTEQVENNIVKERLAIYDRAQAKLKEIQDSERQNEQTRKNASLSIRESELGLAEVRLGIAEQQGTLSEKFVAGAKADLELAKQAVTFERERQNLANQRATAIAELSAKANREAMEGKDNSATIKQMMDLASAFDAQASAQEKANASRVTAIELNKQQNIEIAKQNEELKKQAELLGIFERIASTLESAFGNTGKVIGDIGKALLESAQSQEKFINAKKKEETVIETINNKRLQGFEVSAQEQDAETEAKKRLGKLEKQNAVDQFANQAKIAGQAKSMFKEKTAAFKILGVIEKANHIASMAMNAQQFAQTLVTLPATIAGGVSKLFQQGGWAGFAGAAAFLALMASLGFGGGSVSAPPKGFTAEEQQKVQGSGQVYRDGKLTDTGAGVLGDAAAKSKSVENAIQNMEKYDFKNLEYNNQMLEALKGIRKNTENFAGNLLKSVPGLNIKPETIKSGNWLFGKDTTEVLDQGIKIIGNVGQIIDRSAQLFKYQNMKTSSSGFLGLSFLGGGTSYNTKEDRVTGSPLERDLSLIFKDMGTVLGTAAEDLGMGTAEGILAGFRSIDLSEQFSRISTMDLKPDEMVDAIMSVISSGLDTAAMTLFPSLSKFQKAGESFADTVLRVANDTRVVSLSFEELGLALPKLAEEGARPTTEQLNRLTSAQAAYNAALAANNVERQVYVEDNAYNNTGSYQTVKGTAESARALADALIELSAAQAAVTTASEGMTTRNIDLVQSYIDAAGGLDEFVERNRFFAENFLTEAERLAPIQDRLDKGLAALAPQLAELGITAVTNREQFKQAVFAAQALGEEGVDLFTSLMKLAPAFAEVNKEAASAALSVEEFAKKVFSNEVDILKTQASILEKNKDFDGAYKKAQEATTLIRKAELVEIEKLPEAQRTVLKYQAQYKWSLEDIASATELAEKKNRALIESYNESIRTQQELVSYLDEALGLVNQALNLESKGSNGYAKELERTIKLQDIQFKYAGQENEVRRRVITNLQKYIWALQDLQEAETKYLNSISAFSEAINREISKIDSSVDYLTTALGMVTQALRLEGRGAPDSGYIKNLERTIKLQDIQRQHASEETGTRARVITSLQKYIWALEDEEEARNQYLSSISKLSEVLQTEVNKLEQEVQSFDRVLGMITQALETRGTSADKALSKSISRSMQIQDIEKEFAGGDQTRKASVIGVQKYIWALEDEQEAKDRYVDALNAQVAAAEKEISKLEELVASYDKLLDQKATIAGLTAASNAMAKTISRERELKELRKGVSDDIGKALVRNQEYIWALEDERDLKEKLIEQRNKERDAIQGTIDNLGSAIESLKDYSNSLLLSQNLTTLTPEEQYLQARKTFEEVMTAARTPGMDEAGRAKQLEAVAKLPEVSNAFLELSRTLFASSSNYMADFNLVKMAIDQTSSGLGEQLTEAEKQLKALEESTAFLESIEDATKTTAELLVEFEAAQKRTASAALAADTMSTEQITQLKDVAESQISYLNQQIENTNAIIQSLTEQTLGYEEAAAAAREAQTGYAQASAATLTALEATNGVLSEKAIQDYLESRKEAIDQIDVLNDQLTALQNIEAALTGSNTTVAQATANFQTAGSNYATAQANTGTALTAATQDVNATTIQQALDFRGVLTTQAIAFEKELTALQNIENALKGTLTYDQAKLAYQTAATDYGAAKDATAAALNTVIADVNATTIAGAVFERGRALQQIETDRELIEGLNRVEANTFGVYQSQQAHFQSLITNPQQVNVGTNVAGLLQTIAKNTASTIDTLNEVKQVVKDGTEVTITSNADAVQVQTDAFVEAVAEIADNWSQRSVPDFLLRSGEVRIPE